MNSEQYPLISVVIPIYNPDITMFNMALNSILSNNYSNFEVIISDDSASDYWLSHIIEIQNPRVKIVKNSNSKGIFPNLNYAISHTKGDYIQIFCQDDLAYENLLFSQITALIEFQDAAYVVSQFNSIDKESKIIRKCYETKQNTYKLFTKEDSINLLLKYGCFPGNLSTVMLRKSLIYEIGYFCEDLKYSGDYEYWVRIGKSYGCVISYFPNLAVRTHPKQASNTLGVIIRLTEMIPILIYLIKNNTLKEGNTYVKLYVNETYGVQHLYLFIKLTFKDFSTNYLKNYRLLLKYPFNIFLLFLLLIPQYVFKYRFFKIKTPSI